jgi:hypothetical protein
MEFKYCDGANCILTLHITIADCLKCSQTVKNDYLDKLKMFLHNLYKIVNPNNNTCEIKLEKILLPFQTVIKKNDAPIYALLYQRDFILFLIHNEISDKTFAYKYCRKHFKAILDPIKFIPNIQLTKKEMKSLILS